jgi:hypothetical protein
MSMYIRSDLDQGSYLIEKGLESLAVELLPPLRFRSHMGLNETDIDIDRISCACAGFGVTNLKRKNERTRCS